MMATTPPPKKPAPSMTPGFQKAIDEKRQADQAEDAAAVVAAATPLPGPTREAFQPKPVLEVGPHKLRAFCDRDFVFLATLNHPLVKLKLDNLARKNAEEIDKLFDDVTQGLLPSGQEAWTLFWLLTRPAREVATELATSGVESLRAKAADEFGELDMMEMNEMLVGAVKQFNGYWSTAVGHAPAGTTEEEAKSNGNPT